MPLVPFELRAAVKDLLVSHAWRRRPEMINVELTAACDARCVHCPRLDMDRPMRAMPEPLFRRLVDQAAELGVPVLCPNGYGEICTIPMPVLRGYFAHVRSQAHRFRIIVNSNGNRLTAERADLFIEHGVHLVNVTIDGATAATAESIRRRLSFEAIETNIKALIAMRDAAGSRYPKVRVSMVAMPQTLREIEPFFERWRGIADYIGLGGFSSRLMSVTPAGQGDPATRELAPKTRAARCVLPFRDLCIWADGKAVLCCEDWNEQCVVGDLTTQSLTDIWHGEALAEVRRQHLAGSGHNVALCARCDNWNGPSRGARLWC